MATQNNVIVTNNNDCLVRDVNRLKLDNGYNDRLRDDTVFNLQNPLNWITTGDRFASKLGWKGGVVYGGNVKSN